MQTLKVMPVLALTLLTTASCGQRCNLDAEVSRMVQGMSNAVDCGTLQPGASLQQATEFRQCLENAIGQQRVFRGIAYGPDQQRMPRGFVGIYQNSRYELWGLGWDSFQSPGNDSVAVSGPCRQWQFGITESPPIAYSVGASCFDSPGNQYPEYNPGTRVCPMP